MSILRSLRRGVAKNRMKQKGMKGFCKHSHYGAIWQKVRWDSVFSKRWREFI